MNLSGPGTTGSNLTKPKLGIIGGSGLCLFPELKVISTVRLQTKYVLPSDDISLCEHNGQLVAFLPRHGSKHVLAPHKVPYKANLQALKDIGVEYVIATCITGSLRKDIPPGTFVLLDQFVNLTWGRDTSFEVDGDSFIHLPMGEPYCEKLRQKILEIARATDTAILPSGIVAVIQGPRFSTKAESQWFSANGWDVVNMTQYPECYFAKELGLCYSAIATVTDYDVGLQENLTIDPCQMEKILKIFRGNVKKTKTFLLSLIEHSITDIYCKCASRVIKAYYEGAS